MTVMTTVPEQRGEDDEISFSAAEVCAMAAITYRNLDYWLRAKHVDLEEGHEKLRTPGSGFPRRFTLREAQRFEMLGRLVRAGLRVECAADIVRRRERGEHPVSIGKDVWIEVRPRG